ncbi:MAG: hypothetical protein KGI38_02390 [Thaumarchaeota archaeon]|nr:hypothetical protein [Nitrososphaerota archaeon]
MNADRLVTEAYLARMAGININTMRRYVKALRSLVDTDVFSAQELDLHE